MYDLTSFGLYHAVEVNYIATNVCCRKSATTFGDLPDCLCVYIIVPSLRPTKVYVMSFISIVFYNDVVW